MVAAKEWSYSMSLICKKQVMTNRESCYIKLVFFFIVFKLQQHSVMCLIFVSL